MQAVKMIAYLLAVIGAVNWGLVGAVGLDLIDTILGSIPALARLVYVLVGVSGLYVAYDYFMGGQTTVKKVDGEGI